MIGILFPGIHLNVLANKNKTRADEKYQSGNSVNSQIGSDGNFIDNALSIGKQPRTIILKSIHYYHSY